MDNREGNRGSSDYCEKPAACIKVVFVGFDQAFNKLFQLYPLEKKRNGRIGRIAIGHKKDFQACSNNLGIFPHGNDGKQGNCLRSDRR